MPKIGFRSIFCDRIDGLGSYFAYILLLTIPSLGLSHDIFRQFSAELLALINGQKMISAQYQYLVKSWTGLDQILQANILNFLLFHFSYKLTHQFLEYCKIDFFQYK